MLISPMRSLGIALGFAQRATASGGRLFELLDREPRLQSAPGRASRSRRATGGCELRGVSFAYEGGPPILRDIDLEVDGGTTVALVGATGSGKSTLVTLIGRQYDVTEGAVLIDGVDVREIETGSLRHEIGVVTDDPFLFSATVHDNISYGARTRRARRSSARPSARRRPASSPSCPTATTPWSASAA